jgi:dihydrofolate reductase
MGIVKSHIAMSLDGYSAGPNESAENPLGEGGEQLHEWAFELDKWREQHGREGGVTNASSAVIEEATANVGAGIMGRGMFGGGPGPWPQDPPWDGWWGEDPPFHVPVFVVTHHERESLEMDGGTTFHFVTDGVESAVEQAKAAAGEQDVVINGGPSTIQQAMNAGLLDELRIQVVPLLLHGGKRLLDNLDDGVTLELLEAVEAPGVTHLKHRVVR